MIHLAENMEYFNLSPGLMKTRIVPIRKQELNVRSVDKSMNIKKYFSGIKEYRLIVEVSG